MDNSKIILTSYEITRDLVKDAMDLCIHLISENLSEFTYHFPSACSKNNFYEKTRNDDWTNGFYTGELWLAYEVSGELCFNNTAQTHVDSFLDRIMNRVVVDHHDMGFLYSPSCVAAYQLTGNEKAKKASLLAADNLLSRFHEKGKFFQAWGNMGDKDNYRLIIDCLLNMPLLFWAYKETGNERYIEKATAHIETAMQYVIRPNHSTYHTYFFDPETGEAVKGVTRQGYHDYSAWARGQAWGIYGAALSYKYLRKPEYISIFEQLTDFFIKNLPNDLIPYWDFDFTDGSTEPRDSSASAIAICGMLEMCNYLDEDKADYYKTVSKQLLEALRVQCSVKNSKESNGLLLHGTYAKNSPYNGCDNAGVDECNLWGDYFYMEALIRLHKDWKSYW